MTDARQDRGRILAQDKRIKNLAGSMWLVPSQGAAGGAGYVVDATQNTCTCPDFETRRIRCKHQFAVEFSQVVTVETDGTTTVTETMTVTKKTTYTQDWPAYNAAQCSEKRTVEALLRALCDGIVTPVYKGRGRPTIPLADAVYAMTMKVYTTVSGRRATGDLEACAEAGHIDDAPHYNTVFNYLGKADLTPLLQTLITESAAPLKTVESQFAIDSSGFSTCTYRRWFDAKYGREMKEATWLKAHAMIGTKTNVVTAVLVTDDRGADSPQLPELLTATTKRFDVAEVSADKAYLGHANLAAIEAAGAVPYIPFKSNSKADGSAAWRKMYGLFMYEQDKFAAHYHRRSNVESTFSAIKRKFGPAVRSKTFTAQVNEILCKVLCHNLTMLVHAMHELNIAPTFKAVAP